MNADDTTAVNGNGAGNDAEASEIKRVGKG